MFGGGLVFTDKHGGKWDVDPAYLTGWDVVSHDHEHGDNGEGVAGGPVSFFDKNLAVAIREAAEFADELAEEREFDEEQAKGSG